MSTAKNAFEILQQNCPKIDESLAEKYRDLGYWQYETFNDALVETCQYFNNNTAIIDGELTVTFAEIAKRVDCITANLHQIGLKAGDCVIVQLLNGIEFIEILSALVKLGVIPVLALPTHRYLEISNFCAFTQAKAYFIQDKDSSGHAYDYRTLARDLQSEYTHLSHVLVKGEPQEFYAIDDLYQTNASSDKSKSSLAVEQAVVQAEGVVCFQISGGTTGIPKLIPRRHNEYLYNMRTSAAKSAITQQTVYLCVLPIAHNFAFACPGIMGTLLSGGTVVLSRDSSSEHCFSLIARHQVTLTSLVPPLAILWQQAKLHSKQQDEQLSSLSVLQVGGAKLSYEVAKHIEADLGCRLQQVFGMAEGLICYTELDDRDELVYSTQGKPMSAADEVRVVDDNDRDVAFGEVGQLLTRGPYTIAGYYNMPEHNQKAFTAQGFYRTGDLVKQTADGYLTVVGRAKEIINRGGEKLMPEEVENILLSHDNIVDVAVVGLPDELYGESIHAFIITKEGKLKKPQIIRFYTAKDLLHSKYLIASILLMSFLQQV